MRGEPLLLAVVVGMGSGFFMGTIFVGVGALMLLSLHRKPPKILAPLLRGVSLTSIALSIAGISLLLWGLVGAVLGLLFLWINLNFPGAGLGSPNWLFSTLILVFSLFLSLLTPFLSRKAIKERLGLNFAFALIFGWLLPWLASAKLQ